MGFYSFIADGTKKYFIGTSVGLYSADSLVVHTANSPGTQWQKESDLGECIVNMIDTRKDDGLVAVATYGSGVFTKNYWNYQVKNDDAKDFAYNVSVYPNPTSDKANFKLSLPAAAEVEIELFNVKGDLVERKKEKTFAAGEEIYTLDLSKLAAGTYIYKVRCNQILKTGKLIVN